MEDIELKDEIEDVFAEKQEKFTKKCPACGADIESDAQYCPFCGEKVNGQEEIKKEEKPAILKPRPLAKGEKVKKSEVEVKEFKYGDGHSVSSIALGALYLSWIFPLLGLIVSLIGLKSKNPKDVKLFKIGIIASVVFLIVHIIIIWYYGRDVFSS